MMGGSGWDSAAALRIFADNIKHAAPSAVTPGRTVAQTERP